MICKNIHRWLADRYAGRMAPSRMAELEAHLSGCVPCRQEAGRFQYTYENLEKALQGTQAPDIYQAVLQRASTARRPQIRWLPVLAAATAAVSLLALPWIWRWSSRPVLDQPQVLAAYASDLAALGYGTDDPAVGYNDSVWEQADAYLAEIGGE